MNPFEFLKLLNNLDIEAYIVGGFVRDTCMGLTPNDADIEIYGISYENLLDKVSNLGKVSVVGKSFGVVKLTIGNQEFDLALARTENRIGVAHTDFEVSFDTNLRPEDASKRRDFTINAMMLDHNRKLYDFHNGQYHISQSLLHPVSEAFLEDPLRVLRGMQFASRFNMNASNRMIEYGRMCADEYENLSIDRVRDEWVKWAKGMYPHKGIQFLDECRWLINYQEIFDTKYVPQNPYYHAEGSVFKHTQLVLMHAGLQMNPIITFSALCHDMGKVKYTIIENGVIKSPGHNDPELAIQFCNSIGLPVEMTGRIACLVREHMFDINSITPRTIKRLLTRIVSNDFENLCQLMVSDRLGRIPKKDSEIAQINEMRLVYRELGQENAVKPVIMGRHLVEKGFQPGPQFSVALKAAFEAQLDGNHSFEELLEIALAKMISH
jgi:tRNA nucleotidyltransferase (CCA-adding enzyme)